MIHNPFEVPGHRKLGINVCQCVACLNEKIGMVEFAITKKDRLGVSVNMRNKEKLVALYFNDTLLGELPLPKTKDDLFAAFAQMVAKRLTE